MIQNKTIRTIILALTVAFTLCDCGALQLRCMETNDPNDYGAIQGTTRFAQQTAIKNTSMQMGKDPGGYRDRNGLWGSIAP